MIRHPPSSPLFPYPPLFRSRPFPHGHVEPVLGTVRRLALEPLLSSKPCRERDLVLAMLVERLLDPASKLATTRLWHNSTLAEELSVQDAQEDELYQALDWQIGRAHV